MFEWIGIYKSWEILEVPLVTVTKSKTFQLKHNGNHISKLLYSSTGIGCREYIAWKWTGVSFSAILPPHTYSKELQMPLYNLPQFSRSQNYIPVWESSMLGVRIPACQTSRKHLQKHKFKQLFFIESSLHRTMKEGPWNWKSTSLLPSHKSNIWIQREQNRALSRAHQKCSVSPVHPIVVEQYDFAKYRKEILFHYHCVKSEALTPYTEISPKPLVPKRDCLQPISHQILQCCLQPQKQMQSNKTGLVSTFCP